jgi:hypothetical protein
LTKELAFASDSARGSDEVDDSESRLPSFESGVGSGGKVVNSESGLSFEADSAVGAGSGELNDSDDSELEVPSVISP